MDGKNISAKKVVFTSFIVDITDVVLSLIVAILSGSIVMVVQTLQGMSDLVAAGLLVIGVRNSSKSADKFHPFGYGRELYFWTLISSLIMLSITAVASIYFGWQRFLNPELISNLPLTYLALIISVITNGYSFSLSYRRLFTGKKPGNLAKSFLISPSVETKATFTLDLIGTLASIIGLIALVLYEITGNLQLDGLGAILMGIILAIFSLFLIIGIKDLLVGRSASFDDEKLIKQAALEIPEVIDVLDLKTLHMGPDKLLINLEVHLKDRLTTSEIEILIDKIKENIQVKVPSATHIQVELETPNKNV
jgi:cation diffusion facilitator family transporter